MDLIEEILTSRINTFTTKDLHKRHQIILSSNNITLKQETNSITLLPIPTRHLSQIKYELCFMYVTVLQFVIYWFISRFIDKLLNEYYIYIYLFIYLFYVYYTIFFIFFIFYHLVAPKGVAQAQGLLGLTPQPAQCLGSHSPTLSPHNDIKFHSACILSKPTRVTRAICQFFL